jgi:hypothetical protein
LLERPARRQCRAWIIVVTIDRDKDPRALCLRWQACSDADGDGRKQGEAKDT